MPNSESNLYSEEPVKNIIHVGIDLGTSRSSVSSSNGMRKMVQSYVGWPKDFVAQKMLGKSVLFGKEALEHRLSLELVRPLAGGVIKDGTERDEDAVMELLGCLIGIANQLDNYEVHAVIGVPAEALKVNRDAIKNSVRRFVNKLIIVSEPFSVAYGLGALDNAIVVDIGAGTVDFCIMHGTMPTEEDQRSLVTAGDYIDQQLFVLLKEEYPDTDFTLSMARKYKEEYGFVGAPPERVVVEAPIGGKFIEHDITMIVRRACESIMPLIVETLIDMIGKFDPEYQEQIRNNIILAGGGSQMKGAVEYLEDALHKKFALCKFSIVNDPLFGGSDGALEMAKDMPSEFWMDM